MENAKGMLAMLPLIIIINKFSSVLFSSVNRCEIVILLQCVCAEKNKVGNFLYMTILYCKFCDLCWQQHNRYRKNVNYSSQYVGAIVHIHRRILV